MSIIHDIPPNITTLSMTDPVREGAIERARKVVADANELLRGTGDFMQHPQAPVIWGRMTAELECLVWLLTDGGR